MTMTESIRIALRALLANKMRSMLTMLGIIIGVGAVIALMSVGKGVEQFVAESFQGLGSNLLFVLPGSIEGTSSSGRAELTMGDYHALADPFLVPDATAVSPELSARADIAFGKQSIRTDISGVMPNYSDLRNLEVSEGTFISEGDVNARSRVAVLGSKAYENLFEEGAYAIGQTIKVNRIAFKVIGVLQEKGGSSFGSADITEVLRQRHKIAFRDEDDFTIISQTDIVSIFGDITGLLTFYLGVIAGISLLVGGIGIMNIMLVSVTERTREIGIRKAVGAKKRDIRMQFLMEAMVLSLLGGFIGIVLGVAASQALDALVEQLTTAVTADIVLLSTGISALVGLFFGIYPASRAAALNPIDALRYE